MRRVSVSSAASHLTTRTAHLESFLSFAASAAATLPPRAARTRLAAPISPSHLPVSRPRPPVPPERSWAPPACSGSSGSAASRCRRGTCAFERAKVSSGSDLGSAEAAAISADAVRPAPSRCEMAADGASARAVRDRPSRPPVAGLAFAAALEGWVPALRTHTGTGRAVSCWRASSRAPSMAGSTEGAEPVASGSEKAMPPAFAVGAWPASALSIGCDSLASDEAEAGLAPRPSTGASSPAAGLRPSQPMTYRWDGFCAAGCAAAGSSTRVSKPSSRAIAAAPPRMLARSTPIFSGACRSTTAHMRPLAPTSVASPTTKGRRSSAEDGSSRPDVCSAPSRSAGWMRTPCEVPGGRRSLATEKDPPSPAHAPPSVW
mmetsp:Transcript_25989/g.85252  ORF Transcript_25989/g.85252 Transcript_25989/m.85252 type:complete len:375 (-) Transcript_25989:351-1475(-)